MVLPEHFTLEELLKTSCKIKNFPKTWDQIENLIRLGWFLDAIRNRFGKPIRVNCAFRSPEVNAAVGGVATSAHLDGLAADICAWSGTESDNRLLLKILESQLKGGSIDQLISYHRTEKDPKAAIRFIHVGLPKLDAVGRSQRLYK